MQMLTWRGLLSLLIIAAGAPLAECGQALVDQAQEAQVLCKHISDIKRLPFHRDEAPTEAFKELDPVYGRFRELGDAAVPCLIAEVTNVTVMDDPRQAPTYRPVRVGDVAFWVFMDITGMPYQEALPGSVQKREEKEGAYAYFTWVKKPRNRRLLQQRLQAWYKLRKHGE
jgi:hypothetical protein